MTKTTNPASILARLKNLRQTHYPNIPTNQMLLLYAQQGFLACLDSSKHAEQFTLKGALSLFTLYRETARPTEDIDLAARGMPNTPQQIARVVQEICAIPFPDALEFNAEKISASIINEQLH